MAKKIQYVVEDDLIYNPAIYDAQCNFNWDIPFYLRHARKAKGPVLEFCCGSGRITLPLAQAGIEIIGVDFNPAMLNRAKEKAKENNLAVPFIKGDMRKINLKRKFNLVFIPFNSLQNTYTLNDLEKVFKVIRSHLAPNGRFVFDIFNPSIHYLAKYERLRKSLYKFKSEDGRRVTIDQHCRYDSATQVNRTTWIFHVDHQKPQSRKLDMRCFYPQEMQALLKYNGFKILKMYGDFEEAPFSNEAMKQIYVCALDNA